MYLYDKNGNSVFVYSMELNQEKASEYRESEIIKYGDENTTSFETNCVNVSLNTILTNEKNKIIDIPYSMINYKKFRKFHSFTDGNCDYTSIRAYYDGVYNNANILRVHDYDAEKFKLSIIKYLLVRGGYNTEFCELPTIDGIINLPTSLYVLELMQKGYFDQLKLSDIASILRLFDVSSEPIDEINVQKFENLDRYGLATNGVDKLNNELKSTQKVIQIAKNAGYIKK